MTPKERAANLMKLKKGYKMKQTAVEWLMQQLENHNGVTRTEFENVIQQAKEMEKQQIINAFWNGDNTDCLKEQNAKEFAEQYYNKTFKNE